MVGMARIELATPPMSTRAAAANLLISLIYPLVEVELANKKGFQQRFGFKLHQSNTVGLFSSLQVCTTECGCSVAQSFPVQR